MGGKAMETILPLVAIAGLGVATGGFGLLGAGAAGAGAAGAATATAAPAAAAATSGLSTYLPLVALGGQQILGAMASDNAFQYQTALNNNAFQLQSAETSLRLAEAEKNSQLRLRQALGRQDILLGASGVSASSGSALQAAEAAKLQGDNELSLFAAERNLAPRTARRARREGTAQLARGMLDFGLKAIELA